MTSQPLFPALMAALALSVAACGATEPAAPQPPAPAAQIEPSAAPATDTLPAAAGPPTVVFLGDSLTAGFSLAPEDALPDQVAETLAARNLAIEAVNAGVSGDTTANGLARYDWSVASASPDLLVIALGANDYLLGLSPDVARANLADLIETAQADGIPVILAGIEPRSDAATGSRDAAFAAIYPGLAAEYDIPLLPGLLAGVRDNSDLLLADGLHPTAEGVAIMAERLGAILAPEIAALTE